MSIDFKNKIKNIRTTSPDYYLFARGYCPEPCLGQFFLEYIPICLQSKVCFQVRRPVISTIVDSFMSFYEKSLLKYLIHENSKCHCFISEKRAPKTDTFFNFFCLIFKGHKVVLVSQRPWNFQQTLVLVLDFKKIYCRVFCYFCLSFIKMAWAIAKETK